MFSCVGLRYIDIKGTRTKEILQIEFAFKKFIKKVVLCFDFLARSTRKMTRRCSDNSHYKLFQCGARPTCQIEISFPAPGDQIKEL